MKILAFRFTRFSSMAVLLIRTHIKVRVEAKVRKKVRVKVGKRVRGK